MLRIHVSISRISIISPSIFPLSNPQIQALRKAPDGPSPWMKKWNGSTVVYHHPQRNETVAKVKDAIQSEIIAAPDGPTGWAKKWSDNDNCVVYEHAQRCETVGTVEEAVASDKKTVLLKKIRNASPSFHIFWCCLLIGKKICMTKMILTAFKFTPNRKR